MNTHEILTEGKHVRAKDKKEHNRKNWKPIVLRLTNPSF